MASRRARLARHAGMLALAGTLLAGCSSAAALTAPVMHATKHPSHAAGASNTYTIQVGGFARSFIVNVPNPLPKGPMPLVLMYNGAGGTAAGLPGQTNLPKIADQHGILTAYLQGYDNTWNENAGNTPAHAAGVNDVSFTHDALAYIESHYSVNRSEIAAAGISNGALLVEDLGCKLAGELDLIMPVEGELPVSVSATCKPSRPVSLLEVHGTADSAIPYRGGRFYGVGGGTTVLSAPENLARWASLDRCKTRAKSTRPATNEVTTAYRNCAQSMRVELVTVNGGTHTWPPNFGQLVWSGLSSLPKRR